MRFEELAIRFALKHGMTERDARISLAHFMSFLAEEIQQLKPEQQIKLRGIGTFMVRKRRGRIYKHPLTKQEIVVQDYYYPDLKFSSKITQPLRKIKTE